MIWRNWENAHRRIMFDGLQWGRLRPTDIDVFMEIRGHSYVIGEVKYRGSNPIEAQMMAIGRMAHDLRKAGKRVLAFFAWHDTVSGDIPLADCEVVWLFQYGEWVETSGKTVFEVMDEFMSEPVDPQTFRKPAE